MATTGTDCDDIECTTGLIIKPETKSKDDKNDEEIHLESNFVIFYNFSFELSRFNFVFLFK
jgi:hypothetical protein